MTDRMIVYLPWQAKAPQLATNMDRVRYFPKRPPSDGRGMRGGKWVDIKIANPESISVGNNRYELGDKLEIQAVRWVPEDKAERIREVDAEIEKLRAERVKLIAAAYKAGERVTTDEARTILPKTASAK